MSEQGEYVRSHLPQFICLRQSRIDAKQMRNGELADGLDLGRCHWIGILRVRIEINVTSHRIIVVFTDDAAERFARKRIANPFKSFQHSANVKVDVFMGSVNTLQ